MTKKEIRLTTAAFLFTREKSASEIAALIGDVSKRTIERWATSEAWHAILDSLEYTGNRMFSRNPARDIERESGDQIRYVHDVYVGIIKEGHKPHNAASITAKRTDIPVARIREWRRRFGWREKD